MFDVVVDDLRRAAAAFRPDDPDLADYVVLDFGAFEWREEDEPIVAHPHDPFKRIDIVASTRHVRLELQGRLLAASSRPMLLFETLLPVRFYLPPADVAVELEPSDTVTYCAYKGRASYFSVPGGPADLAWTYHHPLHDAEPVRDRIAFFDERVDVIVDGERRQRPVTRGRAEDGDVAAASNRQAGRSHRPRDHRPVGYDVRRSRRVGVRAQRHGGVGVWRHLLGHQGW
ncbi:hypothetical protein I552_8107 [Mycobacterium xenopi 3993]|nr:hypothetical protein I552_8107 [Mycobacterium xenopi 3993]